MDIKFRAWDSEYNEMLEWERIESWSIGLFNSNSKNYFEIPMQYTGIKDKNGVEIYIGDIVRMNDTIFSVEDIRCTSALVNAKGEFEDYMCNICDMCGTVYEVIGNIYENKELFC